MAEIFKLNKQTIVLDDCLTYLQSIGDKSIDVVVSSPPYNIKKDYLSYSDNLPYQDYLTWMENIFIELKRILKDNGSFFLNIGGTCKEPFIPIDVALQARKHFVLQNNIVWVKSISVLENGNWKSSGHFKPIPSRRFLNQQHESIFHFTKEGNVIVDRLAIGVPYQDKSNIARWNGKSDKRCKGNVWHLPYKTTNVKKTHPAGFPIELPENCIRLHGLTPDLVVLDPFLGAGSTLMACKVLDCYGVGIEIDPVYCELAKANLE